VYPKAVALPPTLTVVLDKPKVGGRKMLFMVTEAVAGGIEIQVYDSPTRLKSIASRQKLENPFLIKTFAIVKFPCASAVVPII
jgi:hypothetical protein